MQFAPLHSSVLHSTHASGSEPNEHDGHCCYSTMEKATKTFSVCIRWISLSITISTPFHLHSHAPHSAALFLLYSFYYIWRRKGAGVTCIVSVKLTIFFRFHSIDNLHILIGILHRQHIHFDFVSVVSHNKVGGSDICGAGIASVGPFWSFVRWLLRSLTILSFLRSHALSLNLF